MGIFDIEKRKNLIKNEDALSYDYVPKVIPFREGQTQEIANSIKPLLEGNSGANLFIHGAPGIGKTASIKWVLRELEETTDDVIPVYVNCWNLKSKYFVFNNIANQLKISFTSGKSAEHVLQQIIFKLKNREVVFVFDEIDKIEDTDFLYQVVSSFPRSCIHLISNNYEYLLKIDPRIKSRLQLKGLNFNPYSPDETYEIIKQRVKMALNSGVMGIKIIKKISDLTYEKGDIRLGINLLRESAKMAEYDNSKEVEETHLEKAIFHFENHNPEEEKLNKEESKILETAKSMSGEISGKVFEKYSSKGGTLSYKSFKRYLESLKKRGLLKLEITSGGFRGRSTRIFVD